MNEQFRRKQKLEEYLFYYYYSVFFLQKDYISATRQWDKDKMKEKGKHVKIDNGHAINEIRIIGLENLHMFMFPATQKKKAKILIICEKKTLLFLIIVNIVRVSQLL